MVRQTKIARIITAMPCRIATLTALLLTLNVSSAETLILNDTNLAPYTTVQGDGFLDVIAGKAFKQAGLELRLVRLPAERGLRNANNGIDDGDLTRIKGIEKLYPNLVRVPEKLIDWEFVAFSRDLNIRTNNWASLKNYNIGLIKGWKIFEVNTKDFTKVEAVRDAHILFTMLDLDRIQVALFARWMGQAYINNMQLKNIHVLEPSLAKREMFIYLNKKHQHHAANIATQLKKLKQTGEYDKLYKEKVLNTLNRNN